MSRLFALGLDGVGLDVWRRLCDRGWLPRLAPRFPILAPLASTVPPLTAPAWTSIATGLNPGRHGVLDFWTRPRPGQPARLIGNSTTRTFWEVASAQGFGVGIFNYPLSYPPRPVNGFWVSGMNTPRGAADLATPAALAAVLSDFTPDIAVEATGRRDLRRHLADRVAFLRELIDLQAAHLAAGLRALRQSDPASLSLFVFALTTTDRFLHFFWDCVAGAEESESPPVALMELARAFWLGLDEGVGHWFKTAAPDLEILFSDHGFGPSPEQVFNMPVWIRDTDWHTGQLKPAAAVGRIGQARAAVKDAAKRHLPAWVWRGLRARLAAPYDSSAQAGSVRAETLYGNVIGLTCSPGPAGVSVDAVLSAARALRDPAGKPIFVWAERAEAVWPGERPGFPDGVARLRDDLGAGASPEDPRLLFPALPERLGDHSTFGILGLGQAGLAEADQPLRVWDIAPLALQLIGAAIPDDLDGVLPLWVPGERLYVTLDAAGVAVAAGYSDDQTAEVTARLKMLGYVD